MLITGHLRQIVNACHPQTREEAVQLWHSITPVRFGDRHQWANSPGSFQQLAAYAVPDDAAFLLVLKTECYTFTDTATAPGFRAFEPSPTGVAQWTTSQDQSLTTSTPITESVPIHLITEANGEFLMVKGGLTLFLAATLSAPPDANVRFIRTTVYGYLINAIISDRLGTGETLITGANS